MIIFAAILGVIIGAAGMFLVVLLLPSGKYDGVFIFDETDPTNVKPRIEFHVTMDDIPHKKELRLKIEHFDTDWDDLEDS